MCNVHDENMYMKSLIDTNCVMLTYLILPACEGLVRERVVPVGESGHLEALLDIW